MIRILSAMLVALVLMGTVALCQYALTRRVNVDLTRAVEDHGTRVSSEAEGAYRLVLVPTFDVHEDPFGLDTGDDDEVRLRVQEGTRELLRWTEDVVGGEPIIVDDLVLSGGTTEWFVEAVPSGEQAIQQVALRLQVLRDGVVYADQTLWTSGGGAALSQRVQVVLEARHLSLDRGLGGPTP